MNTKLHHSSALRANLLRKSSPVISGATAGVAGRRGAAISAVGTKLLCILTAVGGTISAALAENPPVEVHRLDARSQPPINLNEPDLSSWQATSPSGIKFSANNTNILRDGQTFPVTAGEFHPQRNPRELWEDSILKMKAGGLNAISCYFFWTFLEPRPGVFDFSGNNDIRHFLELCRQHDMLVFPRIGPFNNSEILGGGLPTWIFGMPFRERSNDPGYFERVKMYFEALGKEMEGTMWQDGGPVFIVQVENELGVAPNHWQTIYRYGASLEHRGPEDPAEYAAHYLKLREMAIGAGIDPPFFTLTAWGEGVGEKMPKSGFLYGFGGYMYLGPPEEKNSPLTLLSPLPFTEVPAPAIWYELGSGRPSGPRIVIEPPVNATESTCMSRLGASRSSFCGWYLYHGGTNPLHPDFGFSAKMDFLLQLSYDFHAPISEFGVRRPDYYRLRPMHQTILNFGQTFADGPVVFDDPVVKVEDDKLRVSVRRGDGDGGAVFLLHYGNFRPLSNRQAAIDLQTPGGNLRIPRTGSIGLTNGDFAILPYNLDLGSGVKLLTSTAQLCGRLEHGDTEVIFGTTIRDQEAEFVFRLPPGAKVESSGKIESTGDETIVVVKPAMDARVEITLADGRNSILLVPLPKEAVRHSVEATLNGQKTYLISDQDIVVDGNTIRLTSTKTADFTLLAYPPLNLEGGQPNGTDGLFQRTKVSVPVRKPQLKITEVSDQKRLVQMPVSEFDGLHDIYADVKFEGLICRVFDQKTGLPVAEWPSKGNMPFEINLSRFRDVLAGPGLVFYATPDEGQGEQAMTADGMTIDEKRQGELSGAINAITIRPEYVASLEAR
jgi:beta-galactosidase